MGLQVATGAFVSLYSTHLRAAERARVLPLVGAYLILCAALGTRFASSVPLLLTGSSASAALAFAFRLGAPGAVFLVLMYGLADGITGVSDSEPLTEPVTFSLAMSAGVAFSCLVAYTPLLRRVERERPVRSFREILPVPGLGPGECVLVRRITVAALVATAITGVLFDPQRAYWTVSAAIAVVELSAVRSYSISRGKHRTVGTLLGAGLHLLLTRFSGWPMMLVLILMGVQFMIEFVVVRNYALALMFITPLVLLFTGAALGGEDLMWPRSLSASSTR